MERTEEQRRQLAEAHGGTFIGDGPVMEREAGKVRSIVEKDGSVWLNALELAEVMRERAKVYAEWDEKAGEAVLSEAGHIEMTQARVDATAARLGLPPREGS